MSQNAMLKVEPAKEPVPALLGRPGKAGFRNAVYALACALG